MSQFHRPRDINTTTRLGAHTRAHTGQNQGTAQAGLSDLRFTSFLSPEWSLTDGQKGAKNNEGARTARPSPWYVPFPFPILQHTSCSGLQTFTVPQDPADRPHPRARAAARDHPSHREGYEESGEERPPHLLITSSGTNIITSPPSPAPFEKERRAKYSSGNRQSYNEFNKERAVNILLTETFPSPVAA